MASNFLKDAGDRIADFVDWVKEQLADEAIRKSIAEDLGLAAGESIGKPADQPLSNVDAYRKNANPDKEAFVALLNDVHSLYDTVRVAMSGFGTTNVTRVNSIVAALFDALALNYMRLYLPRPYFAIQALGTLVEDTSALDNDPFEGRRFLRTLLNALLFAFSPVPYIIRSLQIGVADEARARFVSDRIFPQMAAFFALAGSFEVTEDFATREVIYGWDSLEVPKPDSCLVFENTSGTKAADAIAERMLTFSFPLSQAPTSTATLAEQIGMTLAIVPRTHSDKPGLHLAVSGEGAVSIPLTDRWSVELEAGADPAFSMLFKIEDKDFGFEGHGPIDLPLNIALVSRPDASDVTYSIPHPDETRIDIGQLAFLFSFNGKTGGISVEARRCALVLATKDQDGFLSKVLPRDGLRVPFSLSFGFSTEKRFFKDGHIDWPTGQSTFPTGGSSPSTSAPRFAPRRLTRDTPAAGPGGSSPQIPNLSGSSKPELGVQTIIPIGKGVLAVKLNHLLLGLGPSDDSASSKLTTEVSVSLAAKVGPVTAVVDRIGFELGLDFPESGGNIGFADLSMGFKAPSGAGIKIDSPFVSGGGFLFLDSKKGQYAGFLQLTIRNTITVTAIGVLTTKLPDGRKGFSFVVMITAQGFKPIQLGLGFTLTGIGGLLAIDRTCNEEFLREGLKNRTLDDLLFPKDPIRNAVQIFGTLNTAFPPQPGSYLFGPVLQISWFTPPKITMNLAVILEVGNRTRMLILGRVTSIMPTEKHDLLRLQMNCLGVIDFDQDSLSLDAVLFDSRLAGKFPITGSMAMRLNWGSAPQFALSIGGFHPAFKPPANFPALERLAITFSNTKNYRLRAECYVAVTSNTVQFGARMDLYVGVSGFSIEGALGIDVLIQFSPFGFIAGFLFAFQIKRGSHNLFKVKIDGQLTGPRPLHIKGKATFEIFWCDFSLPIDHTFIEGDKPPAVEPTRVMPGLIAALNDSNNWSGQLATNARTLVTLRDTPASGTIQLHPLGRLAVKQAVVPLELDIAQFANAKPADGTRFTVTNVTVNGKGAGFDRVRDFFAPSDFLPLTDNEKLAAPSFELMMAGLTVSADSFVFSSKADDLLEDSDLEFETTIIDREHPDPPPPVVTPARPETFSRQVLLGAAARADVRRAGNARYQTPVVKNVVAARGWSVASAMDASAQAAPGLDAGKVVSYAESFQALEAGKRQTPNRAKALMLVQVTRR